MRERKISTWRNPRGGALPFRVAVRTFENGELVEVQTFSEYDERAVKARLRSLRGANARDDIANEDRPH